MPAPRHDPPVFREPPSRSEPRNYTESEFEFLQRVDGPFWARVRNLIEAWFAEFPRNRRRHLSEQLRGRDQRQFAAAFWELYLHATLRGSGLNVTPLKEADSRTPDFEVIAGSNRFFVEATVVSGQSDPEADAERRRGVLLDALDGLRSSRFSLDVHVHVEGDAVVDASGTPLPILEALTSDITHRLDALDRLATEGVLATEDLLTSYGWRWEQSGWE